MSLPTVITTESGSRYLLTAERADGLRTLVRLSDVPCADSGDEDMVLRGEVDYLTVGQPLLFRHDGHRVLRSTPVACIESWEHANR